ncbi:Adenosine monophosphate-protein transferase and cysteine protease IbpA [termite gut metagenome]|uniref:Adenosine monophosphate-protein transferase and cysteine protease IbpA n=1 Tax=termite gut metagenome TaxID=433724 RepID=A0A5J4S0H5_9ZZZZ
MSTIVTLYKEWQSLQPLKPEDQQRLDKKFMLDFNYNSNHLEGNTLTYGQTKLLFLFGETTGNASLKDYEEMKAHNVGLEMIKIEALDKERTLSETFIRELNNAILVRNFWKNTKTASGQFTRYEIKIGVYKTRSNSVITATGELFEYASPEETPALMTDLIAWYREEERKGVLSPLELAALFHYRYIRIHPFEDGNGRIARLLVNYILLRNNYPMIVIQSKEKESYLKVLHQCDVAVGIIPSDGALAKLKQVEPFVDFIESKVIKTLFDNIETVKTQKGGTISSVWWYNNDRITIKNVNQQRIIELLIVNPTITVRGLSEKLDINKSAVQKHLATLKAKDYIFRKGGTKGEWIINIENINN